MAIVVENGADQVEAYTTGKGVFPIPPEVKADNEAREAKNDSKPAVKNDKPLAEAAKEPEAQKAEAGAEDDTEGEDGLTPRQKREFTKSMQATIGKKHRMQKEAEELATRTYNDKVLAETRNRELERQIEEIRAQLKPEVTAAKDNKSPDRADYDSDQAYWEAVADHRVELKLRAREVEQAKQREEADQAETIAHARAKIERAMELQPDFKEVTESAEMAVPPFVAGYMQRSDMFAEIGYHFAKNPAVLAKLSAFTNGLNPGTKLFENAVTRQLVELGKIESTLQPFGSPKDPKGQAENAPEASQKTATQPETGSAPSKPRVAPIISAVTGGNTSQVEIDPSERSTSQEVSAWQRKNGIKLTARKRH
jgi:hypothetical protein